MSVWRTGRIVMPGVEPIVKLALPRLWRNGSRGCGGCVHGNIVVCEAERWFCLRTLSVPPRPVRLSAFNP
jgi:hypothetical protein